MARLGVGVGVLYSNTTFIGDMGPPLQIRQVAHPMEHHGLYGMYFGAPKYTVLASK